MSCGDHTGPVPLGGIKGFNQVFPFLQSISEGKNNTWVDTPLLPNSLWYSGRNSSTQNAFLQVERQRNEVKPRGKPNQTVPPSRPGFGGWSFCPYFPSHYHTQHFVTEERELNALFCRPKISAQQLLSALFMARHLLVHPFVEGQAIFWRLQNEISKYGVSKLCSLSPLGQLSDPNIAILFKE